MNNPQVLKNKFAAIAAAVLLLVTFAVYSPVLKHEFVNWDDGAHLYDNASVKKLNWQGMGDIFTSYVNDIYIPLTTLSFAIEHHFFGLNPLVYHLNNLLLHMSIVLLVFVIGQQLGLSVFAASAGALIFAIHPTHVESVAWVTERKDVLYSFFYLWAVYFYLRYTEGEKASGKSHKAPASLLWAAVGFGVLSLLTKPMALSLPLVLLLLDWFTGRGVSRRTVIEKIPLFILTFLIVWATYAVQARIPGESVGKGALVWIWTLAFYIKQFIFPYFSVPIYRLSKPIELFNSEYISSIILVFIFILILIKYRKNRWLLFGVGFLFVSIFFLLRFDDKADINVVADRFIYLPSMGLCLWLGVIVEQLWHGRQRPFLRYSLITVIAMLYILGAVKAFFQTKIWKDSLTLWTHQLKYFPQEPIALNNLATALRDTAPYKENEEAFKQLSRAQALGDLRSALREDPQFENIRHIIRLYEQALAGDVGYADAVYNLGNLYRDIGFSDEAIAHYQRTIERDSDYMNAYFNLGGMYIQQNDPAQAVEAFDRLIALDPKREVSYENILVAYNKALKEHAEADIYRQAHSRTLSDYNQLLAKKGRTADTYFKMGYVYHDMKNYAQAIAAYKMSLELGPDDPDVLYNLGNAYEESGQPQAALEAYTRVAAVKPGFADVHLNMGVVYNQLGRPQEAEKAFLRAVEVSPKNPDAHFNLGYMYEAQGKPEEAVRAYHAAIKANPRHAEAFYNMGNVYATSGRFAEALEAYKQALTLKPDHMDAAVNASLIAFHAGNYPMAVLYCDKAVALGYQPEEAYLKALDQYR